MKPKVLLRFDTEDYITPESNHALDAILNILDELQIKATFVIVGEKINMLLKAGEITTLKKLQHHTLGYHSYMHSFHPLASEYTIGKDWSVAIEEFLRTEDPGHKTFVQIFDQTPVCYTQPGADWVPHALEALQQWEIPCLFTEAKNTLIDLNQKPFILNGILTFAKAPTISDLTNLATAPQTLENAKNKFAQDYNHAVSSPEEEFLTLICHPGRLVTSGDQYWDQLNFANGKNLPRQEWQIPPLKERSIYEQDLLAFKDFLIYLSDNYELEWITAQDLVDMYQNRIILRDRVVDRLTKHSQNTTYRQTVSMAEVRELAHAFTQEISYYTLRNIQLSPIQATSILCQTIWIRAKEGYFPESVPVPEEIFLSDEIPQVTATTDLDRLGWSELVEGANLILNQIKKTATFPAILQVYPNLWVSMETFVGGLAQAIVTMIDENLPQDRVLLPHPRLQTKDHVKKPDQVYWDWPIFPKDFQNPELPYYAELLSWTIKPL